MESNYQTTNQDIFNLAIDLADNKKYEELNPTDNYLTCDCVLVDHDKKRFFFTKKNTESHINKLKQL